jgi:hypothetical protein
MNNLKNGKIGWALALVLGGMLLSIPVLAMEQGSGGDKPMEGGMPEMVSGQIMLGKEVKDGVRAMIHLSPVTTRDASGATHHLMVKLTDSLSRKTITDGDVTVKVISPEEKTGHSGKTYRITQYVVPVKVDVPKGKVGAPREKMGMSGHFGTNVTLDSAGIWHFEIVTKLADDVERTFDAHYQVK